MSHHDHRLTLTVVVLLLAALAGLLLPASGVMAAAVSVLVPSEDASPLLSFLHHTSAFQQAFNPSYVVPSSGTGGRFGLLVRSQNCTSAVGGPCVHCEGDGPHASVIAFSEITVPGSHSAPPTVAYLHSVVFQPANGTFDDLGTEDPRIAYDPYTELYYMFYTSYGSGNQTTGDRTVLLSVASTSNPTTSSGWVRHGPVFPSLQGSKSAALVVPSTQDGRTAYHLLWGDTSIRLVVSSSPTAWPSAGDVLLSPRPQSFDSALVEAGPPPLRLSDGNLFFLHNSANGTGAYHASWAVLSGRDPSVVLARADTPLLSPTFLWEQGLPPYTCNVRNVVFLEAAATTELPDVFRVYFGGADAVVGTAVVKVSVSGEGRYLVAIHR